ncbi:FAD-dependent monooxygenase [Streptomyces sp. NBC_00103]|uniref:FAD-dependent monooxygenase n=1 Tax=Streptomyces sp. NBC_00103 TaxID=2975653 RepID=UPI002B1D475E|nr:FAD-dependent monooxygenase [Streptomyces sp. NBC_00103]
MQGELEGLLEERARGLGVRVWRGLRVCGVSQGSGGVRVEAVGAGGVVVFEGGFVVGADGARSVVRGLGGFGSRVYPASVSAMAGDVWLERGDVLRAGWHRTERGWILVRDVGGGVTRVRTLNCSGVVADRHAPLGVEELRREVSFIVGREVAVGGGRWLSRFSDFARLVSSYRRGRIVLAGDAAHVHFPIGGQGLSTGLLDALGLGWKLALAVRGRAGVGLLDTYGAERRPAAQRVIDHTRAQLALMRPDPGLDPLRALFGELMAGGGSEGSVLAAMVSGQDTVLPVRGAGASPWEGRFVPNVVLSTGEGRVELTRLLGAGRPLLLVFGEGAGRFVRQARPWAGLVRVVRAAAVAEVDCEALLVRPDGYAGWAAGGGELEDALRAYFGPGTRASWPQSGDTAAGPQSGDLPSGEAAAVDLLSGDAAAVDLPSGDAVSGDAAAGVRVADAVAGDAVAGPPSGDLPSGDLASGDLASGDAAAVDLLSGDAAAVDLLSGDAVSGDAVTGVRAADAAAGVRVADAVAGPQSGDLASGDLPSGDAAAGVRAADVVAGDAVAGGWPGGVTSGGVSAGDVASGAQSGGVACGDAAGD